MACEEPVDDTRGLGLPVTADAHDGIDVSKARRDLELLGNDRDETVREVAELGEASPEDRLPARHSRRDVSVAYALDMKLVLRGETSPHSPCLGHELIDPKLPRGDLPRLCRISKGRSIR